MQAPDAVYAVVFHLAVGGGVAHRAVVLHPTVGAGNALDALTFPPAVRAGVALRAAAFHLAVGAGVALRALAFQLAVGASLALYALVFPLAMRTRVALRAAAFQLAVLAPLSVHGASRTPRLRHRLRATSHVSANARHAVATKEETISRTSFPETWQPTMRNRSNPPHHFRAPLPRRTCTLIVLGGPVPKESCQVLPQTLNPKP